MNSILRMSWIVGSMLCLATSVAAEDLSDKMTYFNCDFNDNSMPEGMATYDLDGLTLYFQMVQEGFVQGDSWIVKKEPKAENYYIASTSKYKFESGAEHKPSNDWLVTPAIRIKGKDAVLSWRGKSFCSKSSGVSGYKVYVSTKGNKPEDFEGDPVMVVDVEESNKWTRRNLSLADYEGQYVYIAFVNDNLDKEILAIDDIKVQGTKGHAELTVNTADYVYGTDHVKIEATVTAYTQTPVNQLTAYYSYGDNVYTKSVDGLSLGYHESYTFAFDEVIPVAVNDTVHYKVWAEVDGEKQDPIDCTTYSYLFKPTRRVVIEEGTGMWCSYCPKGIVAMEILAEKYPEQFIGLAVHYDDALEVKDYVLPLSFPCFPSAWINRKYMCETPMVVDDVDGENMYTALNGGLETYFVQEMNTVALGDISLNVSVSGGKVTASTVTRFAIDRPEADYQIAFAVYEDEVTGEDYYQANGLSGGIPMGGYEKKPDRIENFVFDHVARGIFGDYKGVPGSVPSALVAGTEYKFDYTFDLPEDVDNVEKCKIVAMIIDQATGEIVNANVVGLGQSGIGSLMADSVSMQCRRTAGGCHVDFTSDSTVPATVNVYTVGGVLLASQTVAVDAYAASCDLSVGASEGLLIVTVSQLDRTIALKVK